MKGPVYLRDVAAKAGVSVGAASQAINGTGTISEKTRQHILKVAEEMGYQRDVRLSAIAARRFRAAKEGTSVALLNFTTDPESGKRLVFFSPDCVQATARKLGLELLPLRNFTDVDEARAHVRILYHRGVEGVLFGSVNLPEVVRACDWGPFTVLGVGDSPLRLGINRVEPDWAQAVRDCCQKLTAAGCKRIGLITYASSPASQHDRQRVGAYFADRWEAGRRALPPCTSTKREEILAWFRKYQPDGVVVFGLPLVYELVKSGIHFPGDARAALVQKVHKPEAEEWLKPFAGVRFDQAALGEQALEIFFSMLVHRERGLADYPRITRLRMPWESGPSCP